jgi:hypothetical protein
MWAETGACHMSEFDNYDSEDQIEESETRNPVRARMKQLEKETADLRKQVAEAESAKRELAFVKAGLDPLQPMTKYFVKAYDGDLTPDAIRQAAVEAQLISPPQNQPSADEMQAWQRTNKVAAGSQTSQPPVDWTRRLNEATSPREVEQILSEARAATQN